MKKKWIILIAVIAVLIAAVVLILCLPARGNRLWATASPAHSALSFYICDGETTWHGNLYEAEKAEAFLKELSSVGAKPAKDWSPDKAEYPLYGVAIGDGIDRTIKALWTNGYLLFDDGSVYRFPFDFSNMKSKYAWDLESDRGYLRYLPSARFVAQGEEGWNPEFMVPSRFEPDQPEGLTMGLTAVTAEKVEVLFSNHSDRTWSFGASYNIDVLLDGVWYDVPTLPDQELTIPSIAWVLDAGGTHQMTYSLSVFGDLPAGTYRLTAEGMSVEFTR